TTLLDRISTPTIFVCTGALASALIPGVDVATALDCLVQMGIDVVTGPIEDWIIKKLGLPACTPTDPLDFIRKVCVFNVPRIQGQASRMSPGIVPPPPTVVPSVGVHLAQGP